MNLGTISAALSITERGVTLPPVVMWMKPKQLFSACFARGSRAVELTLIHLFTASGLAMDFQWPRCHTHANTLPWDLRLSHSYLCNHDVFSHSRYPRLRSPDRIAAAQLRKRGQAKASRVTEGSLVVLPYRISTHYRCWASAKPGNFCWSVVVLDGVINASLQGEKGRVLIRLRMKSFSCVRREMYICSLSALSLLQLRSIV